MKIGMTGPGVTVCNLSLHMASPVNLDGESMSETVPDGERPHEAKWRKIYEQTNTCQQADLQSFTC